MFRLLPLYFLLLVLFSVAAAVWPASRVGHDRLLEPGIPLWSYWGLVQNFLMSSRNYLGNEWLRVTWSLAVEVQFYALICLVVAAAPRERLGRWLVALGVAAVGLRYAVVLLNPAATTPLVVQLPCRLDAFLAGGIVGLLPMPLTAADRIQRERTSRVLLVLSVAAFCWFVAGGFGGLSRYVLPTYYLMLATGSAAFLVLCATSSPQVRWAMESRPMIRMGQLSYFLYLFHLPVMWTIYAGMFGRTPTLESAAGVAIMALVVLALWALGELSYRFVEAPLIRRSHGYFRAAK